MPPSRSVDTLAGKLEQPTTKRKDLGKTGACEDEQANHRHHKWIVHALPEVGKLLWCKKALPLVLTIPLQAAAGIAALCVKAVFLCPGHLFRRHRCAACRRGGRGSAQRPSG